MDYPKSIITEYKNITHLLGDDVNGEYYISRNGVVKRVKGNKEKILKPRVKDNKYMIIGCEHIRVNGKRKTTNHYIHRLVAMAFIPNPDNLPQVNHKDFNVQNNNVSNLEWLSAHDNTWYSREHYLNAIKTKKKHTGRTGEQYIGLRILKNGTTIYRVNVPGFPETQYRDFERAKERRTELLNAINNTR